MLIYMKISNYIPYEADKEMVYQTSSLRAYERLYVRPVILPDCSSSSVKIYFKMRWDEEWQLREELCGTRDENIFVAGAEESLYIEYKGNTKTKLIFCAENKCEFSNRKVR